MILDTRNNIELYRGISENLDKGIDFLMAFDADDQPDGRYEIDGQNVYATVSSPALKPRESARYEAHRNYIDIQVALEDGEEIGWDDVSALAFDEYDAARDICFAEAGPNELAIQMKKGMFAIFFPNDAHSPCRAQGEQTKTRKIVIKVKTM